MRSRNLGTSDGPERSIAFLAAASAVLYAAGGSVAPAAAGYAGDTAVVVAMFAATAALTALYVDRTLAPGFWVAAPAASATVAATIAASAGLLPANTWTYGALAAGWAVASGATLAVAVERRADLRMPAYGVGFVLSGTVIGYVGFATLGLLLAVFVGDAAAFALGGVAAAASSYVYCRLIERAETPTATAAGAVLVATSIAYLSGAAEPEVALAAAVVNVGFVAGALASSGVQVVEDRMSPS